MKRTALARKTPLRAKAQLRAKAPLVSTTRLQSSKLLRRTKLVSKRRKPKPGDEPRYKAWIKTQPCVVAGRICGKVDPHHMIDGAGDARKGMGQTAPDKYLLPLCHKHHNLFHAGLGFCKGWSKEARRAFQEQEVDRLRSIWRDLNELGVLQEPERRVV